MEVRHKKLWRLGAITMAGVLLLGACGSDKDEESTSTDTAADDAGADAGGDTASGDKVIKIGLIAPLSGDLSALGLGMRNSVQLAVDQANESGELGDWTIEFVPEDDTAKPEVGAQVAAKMASDDAVVGVVGTLNSSVALSVQPVLDKAGIVMISPANTNPALTQGDDPANPKRPYEHYFRVATTDAIQGPFAAAYAKEIGKVNAAVIHDNKAYGKGLAEAFAKQFEADGGKIVATEVINPDDKDFNAVISKIKDLNPDLIYYGGEYPQAGPLSNQAKAAGLNVPVFGGDGIYDGKYIELAGDTSAGDLATSVGAPPEKLDTAKDFIAAYEAAGFDDGYSAYGPQAYDAANVIIESVKTAMEGRDAVDDEAKAAILEAVQAASITGATGAIAFDMYGDNTTKILTVYKVDTSTKPEDAGKLTWVDVKTGEF